MPNDKPSGPECVDVPAMGVEQLSPVNSSSSECSATLAPGKRVPCPPSQRPTVQPNRLARACLNLPPAFFSLNMGTGIASILLHNLPYNAGWLRRLGIVIFILNIVIFALLAVGNIVRYVRWKGVMRSVNTHPAAGLFWGCLPMGLATIVVSRPRRIRDKADPGRTWSPSSASPPGVTDGPKSLLVSGGSMSCSPSSSTSA